MTVKEKQGFGLYFLFAFGMAWLWQVGGCMALLQQNNAVLYQLALIVTMFCPLLAVLLAQNASLRQQYSQQRTEHGDNERQLIQHGVILLQKRHAAAHLTQPCHAKGEQEV